MVLFPCTPGEESDGGGPVGGVPAGMPQPFPPAIGLHAGSEPGTQSDISGDVSLSLLGLYAPFGYVGHPLLG